MTDINLKFCRVLLQLAMLELTGNEVKDFRANSGCLKSSFGNYLVEWPKMGKNGSTFCWENYADNAYDAKAKAINAWLEYHAPTVRAKIRENGWSVR